MFGNSAGSGEDAFSKDQDRTVGNSAEFYRQWTKQWFYNYSFVLDHVVMSGENLGGTHYRSDDVPACHFTSFLTAVPPLPE